MFWSIMKNFNSAVMKLMVVKSENSMQRLKLACVYIYIFGIIDRSIIMKRLCIQKLRKRCMV
jgi:hypothetical protein